jgi:hypothetical protein
MIPFFSGNIPRKLSDKCMIYIATHRYLVESIEASSIMLEGLIDIWSDKGILQNKHIVRLMKDRLNLLIILDDKQNNSNNEHDYLTSEIIKEENRIAKIVEQYYKDYFDKLYK